MFIPGDRPDGSSAARTAVVVAAAVLQHEVLLLDFGKRRTEPFSFLIEQELTGGSTFGSDSLFQFASLHCLIVIRLTELPGDVVFNRGKSALGFAAAIGDLELQIALTELRLITKSGDVVVHSGKLTAEIHIEIAQSVPDAVDILGDEVQTGFVAGGGSRIVHRQISGKVAVTVASAAAVAAIVATAPVAESAPAEKQQPGEKTPHPIHAAETAAIGNSEDFPGVGTVVTTVAADGIDVVDRYCFHNNKSFLFLLCPFNRFFRAFADNLSPDSQRYKNFSHVGKSFFFTPSSDRCYIGCQSLKKRIFDYGK